MWHTRIRLRKSIRKIEDEKLVQQPRGYSYRKAIHDKHALAFFLIGMSTNLNLDTSLLTQKVFEVENFANITVFMYFGVLVSVVFLYLFLIEPHFYQLVASVWFLVISRVFHLILAIFATGKMGRNLFLVFYTLNGFLRGVISLTSNYVIANYFLNKSYLHLLNGCSMYSIVLSILQMACDEVIGTDTMKNSRKSLIVAQTFNLLITVIGCVWITITYSIYSTEDFLSTLKLKEDVIQKTKKAINKFKYSRFYISKLMVIIISSTLRVAFHPVIIPYTMDIKNLYKLLGSIMFTVFEFIGRLTSFEVDEYIDPNKKSINIDHDTYLLLQDIPHYLLILIQISACCLAIYSTWNQKFGISKSQLIVILITMSSGFIVGFTSNCAFEGAQASLQYYSYLNSKKNLNKKNLAISDPPNNIITAEVATDTSNANDILTLFNYISYIVGSIISYVSYKIIKAHKETAIYIIKSRSEHLDFHSVYSLAQKLNL